MTQETLNSAVKLSVERNELLRRLTRIEEAQKDFSALYGEDKDIVSSRKLKYLLEIAEDKTGSDSNSLYGKLIIIAKEWLEQYTEQIKDSISEIDKQIEML